MITIKRIVLILSLALFVQSCSSTKVMNSWKGEQNVLDKFKGKNILVIARTADNSARIAFESAIANELRARGMKVTESFTRAPKIYPNKEMSEDRVKFIKTLLDSEGYNGIVLTVIKQQEEHTETSASGVYVGASYSNYYPAHYGGFYNYYSYPYAYGSYYDSFGGYIPLSTSTRTYTNYVLETVAYNLDEKTDQLVAVVTTSLTDPREAYKTADKYVEKVMYSLDN